MAASRLSLTHRHIIRQRHSEELARRTRLRMGLPVAAPTNEVTEPAKLEITIRAMLGKGDNLHVRAAIKEYMRQGYQVHLRTPSLWMFHDLIARGLKCYIRETNLHAQKRQLDRERPRFGAGGAPPHVPQRNIGYNEPDVAKAGTIAKAVFITAGLPVPDGPADFSMPVLREWRAQARELIAGWSLQGKPLLVYRPLTLRHEWDGSHRNCDPDAYAALLGAIRERFFVVSVADLAERIEWIVGAEQPADVKLHHGELSDEVMAGLFAEADLVMSPAGFAPVLAQAVGTPIVTVYGRRESYRTTETGGAHLAPTLGIDPDQTCDCHSLAHRCQQCKPERAPQKHITLEPAIARLTAFVAEHAARRKPPVPLDAAKPNVLLFGTVYEDNGDRAELTDQWIRLARTLSPECDLLIVDSASPHRPSIKQRHPDLNVFDFGNNVGHLSRRDPKTGNKGRDGWGRAFCKGLHLADEYDFAVHIEVDLLFSKPVMPVIEQMVRDNIDVVSVPVRGEGRRDFSRTWVETGLMFFRTKFIREFGFVEKYDWANRRELPTPEVIISRLLVNRIHMMPWKVLRANHNTITADNVLSLNLDGVTHSHSDKHVYEKFVVNAIGAGEPAGFKGTHSGEVEPARETGLSAGSPLKLNFGCGENKLAGWTNFDAEVDIEKPLPFGDASADFILAEHVVEHTDLYKAISFFKECHRVLKPGGVMRIAVPSLEQVYKHADEGYCKFVRKWAPTPDLRGALHAMLYAHGHKAAWTGPLLEAVVYYVGFVPKLCQPGQSDHPDLHNVEGHHWIIGPHNNGIETVVCEGRKDA